MTQKVRVKALISENMATVIHVRQSACSGDCHKCSGCGAQQETLELTARNPIGAKPGDLVVMEAETGPVLKAAAMLYLLPLGLFFLGYLLGQVLWGRGGLVGCLAFAAAIGLSVCYDRLMGKKKETEYTITGFAP
jgi:sigma-E factor negative regulatory protein RseC